MNTISGNDDILEVPGLDLLTFAFENARPVDEAKPVYIDAEDPTRSLSKSQTRTLVRKLISGLKFAGLRQGNPVLVVLANNFLYSAIYFSIIGAGGLYLGANPTSQVFELNHIVQLSEPKFIVTSQDGLSKILEASHNLSSPPEAIFVVNSNTFPLSAGIIEPSASVLNPTLGLHNESLNQHIDLICLLDHGESDWIRIDNEAAARSTPAAMFSTSGTSGLPKVAVSSHYALVSQHVSMETTTPYDVRRLISLPLFHVFAALFAHVYPIRLGHSLHVLPRFQLERYVDAIYQYKITDTVMAPPIVHALNRSPPSVAESLHTLKWVGVGGAPISAESMRKFRTKLEPSATLSQVWGMTEIGVAMLVRYPEQDCDGSIGRPLPGYEMRLIDSFGNIVTSDHEPGELQVRYDGMMTGYKHQPPLEKGDWYATGDIMTMVDSKYYVVGRSKELIKVNGWQVAPAELEAVLMSHPCITDAGVIGVLQEDGSTELPRAYVVRNTDTEGRCSTLSAEAIYEFTRNKLASYKALKGGIFFIDWIPRTASGKIQRFKLAQMDRYRRSVTELLVLNTDIDADRKREKIKSIKARTELRRTTSRRGSRLTETETDTPEASSRIEAQKPRNLIIERKRSRQSLIEKMKALESSRLLLHSGGTLVTN